MAIAPTTWTRRRALAGLGAVPFAAAATAAVPPEVTDELAAPRLHGQARFRYYGVHVYDIRLWVGAAFRREALDEMPLALELEYARRLDGAAIAERSLAEMQRTVRIAPEQADRWLEAMRRVFPDVGRGDRLTGSHRPGQAARFFHNGRSRGEVNDAAFAHAFFGIWLAPTSSAPELRRALLGATP